MCSWSFTGKQPHCFKAKKIKTFKGHERKVLSLKKISKAS